MIYLIVSDLDVANGFAKSSQPLAFACWREHVPTIVPALGSTQSSLSCSIPNLSVNHCANVFPAKCESFIAMILATFLHRECLLEVATPSSLTE